LRQRTDRGIGSANQPVEQAVSNEQYDGVPWAHHNVLFTADSLLRNNRRDVLVRKRLIELMLEELDKVCALRESKGDSLDRHVF